MTRRDIAYYRLTCDECGHSEIYERYGPWPKGWGGRKIHDCGLTGYTAHEDLCPKCTASLPSETPHG